MIRNLIISGILAFGMSGAVHAADLPVDIKVNGEYLLTDTAPYIEDSLSFAPIRAVSEALGARVDWDADERSARIDFEGKSIKMFTAQDRVTVNGEVVEQGVGLRIRNDRIMVPVRLVSELLGARVDWDDLYRNVDITKNGTSLSADMIDFSFNDDELYWLSRIIDAESCGESFSGKVAVGDVVMNRVKSTLFPDTIYGVIFDRKHGVQFEPVINGSIYNEPCTQAVAAAKVALRDTTSTVGESLYFFAPSIAQSSWIENNRKYYTTIGNHVFYL